MCVRGGGYHDKHQVDITYQLMYEQMFGLIVSSVHDVINLEQSLQLTKSEC